MADNRTEVSLVIHDASKLPIEADAWAGNGMILSIGTEDAPALRLVANDTAALLSFLMRLQNAVASEAARARPNEPEPVSEPAEDRTLPPCDTCRSEPVCVIDGPVRQCSGCYLAAQEVGV